MKKFGTFFLLFVLLMPLFAYAQHSAGKIVGTVIDADSREPVAAATVSVLGTNYSVRTAKDGQYKIEGVPGGYYQVKAEGENYVSQVRNNVFLADRDAKVSLFFTLSRPSGTKEIGELDEQPSPISPFVSPKYPDEARKQGIEGTVYVKLLVNDKGVVERAVVEQSDAEILNQASIDAAMKWKFKPGRSKGTPVSTWIMLPFKFKLAEGEKEAALDVQPKPVKTKNPSYPEGARRNKVEGEFWFDILVDERGEVKEVSQKRLSVTVEGKKFDEFNLTQEAKEKLSAEAYNNVKEMSEEAISSVKSWKFTPGQRKGKNVSARVTLPIRFKLDSSAKK